MLAKTVNLVALLQGFCDCRARRWLRGRTPLFCKDLACLAYSFSIAGSALTVRLIDARVTRFSSVAPVRI